MGKTQRIEWMDVTKGVGALLVLIGHFAINNKLAALIYCFHMPLFFFLSGMIFNIDKYKTFKQFFISKFNALMIPYFIFNLFIWMINTIRILLCGVDNTLIVKKFLGIFLGIKTTDYYGSVWFVSCMFIVQILAYFVIRFAQTKKWLVFVSSLVSLVIGYAYVSMIGIPLLWGVDTAMIALFFLLCGYCFGTSSIFYSKKSIILFVPMIFGAFWNFKFCGCRVEMYANQYGNFLVFLLVAFCGIFATIAVGKILEHAKFLQMLGTSSLYLYGAQLIFADIFQQMASEYNLWWLSIKVSVPITMGLAVVSLTLLLWVKKYYDRFYAKCMLLCCK